MGRQGRGSRGGFPEEAVDGLKKELDGKERRDPSTQGTSAKQKEPQCSNRQQSTTKSILLQCYWSIVVGHMSAQASATFPSLPLT